MPPPAFGYQINHQINSQIPNLPNYQLQVFV